jgi:hypothetical protein
MLNLVLEPDVASMAEMRLSPSVIPAPGHRLSFCAEIEDMVDSVSCKPSPHS